GAGPGDGPVPGKLAARPIGAVAQPLAPGSRAAGLEAACPPASAFGGLHLSLHLPGPGHDLAGAMAVSAFLRRRSWTHVCYACMMPVTPGRGSVAGVRFRATAACTACGCGLAAPSIPGGCASPWICVFWIDATKSCVSVPVCRSAP